MQKILSLPTTFDLSTVTYKGPKENLPEIFRRINAAPVTLTDYEVFAASWIMYEFSLESLEDKLRVQIFEDLKKYYQEKKSGNGKADKKQLLEYNFNIDDVGSDGKIQLFELLQSFATRLALNTHYRSIMSKKGEVFIFTIFSLLLSKPENRRPNKIDDIVNGTGTIFQEKYNKEPENLLKFLLETFENIEKAIEFVSGSLTRLELKGKDAKTFDVRKNPYSVYRMIMAYIDSTTQVSVETLSYTSKNQNKNDLKQLKKVMFHRAIYERLSKFWKGDNRQVSAFSDLLKTEKLTEDFEFPPPADD